MGENIVRMYTDGSVNALAIAIIEGKYTPSMPSGLRNVCILGVRRNGTDS